MWNFVSDPIFNFAIPVSCPGIPEKVLDPILTWQDRASYQIQAEKLAQMFIKNFEKYRSSVTPEVVAAGPKVSVLNRIIYSILMEDKLDLTYNN